ncbi:respiratory chain complex I subunit 1 family protein [Nitratifractor salsuginis]|uniref:Ni-Fe hydrogenase, membrane subunit HycD/HyfD n=1 Tax=Nitratifractor salsuginis (strain DSM 16511 / JCM 12458 / E9I37-1) TaxID=749222 RepID=E6X223_NITSE|nr:NADH-quinone oxidoreductase subunit H [Nitratifractor salsuginis]ADV47092.1 Ni-Fe hydrogenase, membrane subunit HycD/HyfD [Nitratifractor salsuginis DSM 16511]
MILYFVTIVLLLALAPILLSFIKAVKMWLLYKRPVSLLQGYRDFSKLLGKETVLSREASVMTRVAPFLVLAPLLIVLFYLPPAVKGAYYVSFVDAFTITGLLALSTFFLMLLGLDSASSFGGMGSSREAFISALVEPAMVLTIFSVSMMAGDLGVGQAGVNLAQHFPREHMASYLFAAISFFILLIAENGRIPVDNPETHLELTMVHEAMILDITGIYLAIIETAASVKFVIFASLFATLFLPFGMEAAWPLALLIFVGKLFAVALAVALIEVNTAKLRLFKVPDLLGIAIVFAFLSLITFYVLGA